MIVGLSSGVTLAWWLTLAAGLVVALVVTALLETLRRKVKELEAGVEQVLLHGGHVAQNTWAVQLLKSSKVEAGRLLEELGRHGATPKGTRI